MNADLYRFLQRVASQRRLVTYLDVAPLVGVTSTKLTSDRKRIDRALADICRHEVRNRRPMLSAIVVKKNKNRPGKGFFTLAKKLKRQGRMTDAEFFGTELARVLTKWADRR